MIVIDLNTKIKDCDLSARIKNLLIHNHNIKTIKHLTKYKASELRKMRCMGEKSMNELIQFLVDNDIKLNY